MTNQEILSKTKHRPWPIPSKEWKFYQEWNDAIFLHYQVDLNVLKKFVPTELEIDLFEGVAWVSIVAFTMEKIRPKYLPAFPPVSNFDEINIRTYVKSNGKTGVYFLSIEGGKQISCNIAKGISELPYRYSTIHRKNDTYKSHNTLYGDRLHIAYTVGDSNKNKSNLDRWLTERYALFQDAGEAINEFEIHHVEWPINEIEIHQLEVDYSRFDPLIPTHPNLTQYSRGVQVLAWGKVKRSLRSCMPPTRN